MYTCEYCGNEFEKSLDINSIRFCCEHHRRQWISKTSMTKRIANETFVSPFKTWKNQKRAPFGTWKCPHCNFIGETRAKLKEHQHKEHPQFCVEGGWNKGLTKETNSIVKNTGETYKNNLKSGKIIPGFKGKTHSLNSKNKMSETKIRLYKDGKLSTQRIDVKYYSISNINNKEYKVQGLWELNVAKRLNELGIVWQRNKVIKYFKEDKSIHRYIPDFYIPEQNSFIEVKGFYGNKDKDKMKLVLTQNNIKLYFIDKTTYYDFINGKINLDNTKMAAVV